jgi:hypothetical protein
MMPRCSSLYSCTTKLLAPPNFYFKLFCTCIPQHIGLTCSFLDPSNWVLLTKYGFSNVRLRFSLNVDFLKSKALMPISPVGVQVQLQKVVPKITPIYLRTSQGTTLSCPKGKCKVTQKGHLKTTSSCLKRFCEGTWPNVVLGQHEIAPRNNPMFAWKQTLFVPSFDLKTSQPSS